MHIAGCTSRDAHRGMHIAGCTSRDAHRGMHIATHITLIPHTHAALQAHNAALMPTHTNTIVPFVHTCVCPRLHPPAPSNSRFVIDASAASIFSYLWSFKSYERLLEHELDASTKGMLREEITLTPFSKIMIILRHFPGNFDDRVFALMVWREEKTGSELHGEITLAFGDVINSADQAATNAIIQAHPRASKASTVRASTKGYWRLTPIAPNVFRATLIQQVEVGGTHERGEHTSEASTRARRAHERGERTGEARSH